MEGQNSPTIVYESGNDNIAPPAYTIPPQSQPIGNNTEYIEYPQFIPRRQIISDYQQQSAASNKPNTFHQPLIQPPPPPDPRYNSLIIHQQPSHSNYNNNINPTQIVVVSPNHNNNIIAYPTLITNNNNNHNHNHNQYPGAHKKQQTKNIDTNYHDLNPPPHQDLFCLAFITFFFFPIFGLLAMCKASEANTAYKNGDYALAAIYNRQCRIYMKWAIVFCIVIILFAIAMNVIMY